MTNFKACAFIPAGFAVRGRIGKQGVWSCLCNFKYVASPHTLSGVLALTMPSRAPEASIVPAFGASDCGLITPGGFPKSASKAPAFATLTRIMTPCPFAKSQGIMEEVEWALMELG